MLSAGAAQNRLSACSLYLWASRFLSVGPTIVGNHKNPAIFDHDGGAITAKSWEKTDKEQTYTIPELPRFMAV